MASPNVPPTALAVLRSSALLSPLGEADMEELASVSRLSFAEKGETIWLSNEATQHFGIAATGFVKMVQSTARGQEITHEIMGPGQVFGLLGIVEGSGCPLSARAVNKLWYLKVPKREFMPFYDQCMPLKDHIVRRLTTRLRGAHELMARTTSTTVDSRLAAIIIMLAESYGVEQKSGELLVNVPLSRQDLADLAGTTSETTIRTLSRWRKQGVVDSEEKRLRILNLSMLESMMI